jgi:flagellar protein FlaG
MGIDINGLNSHPYSLPPKPETAQRESARELNRAVQELQNVSRILNRRLRFSINRQLDQVVVKVIDTRTDKVIKELPPAEVQEMRIRIRQAIDKIFE